ncbi:MAG TPA: crosslink repair DNA glycosylase YcaQ family protein [Acidimicrobiia bacterium]
MARSESLSLSQARRIALAAQGFGDRRPEGRVDRRHLRKVFARLGALQIDSVNVLVRSHYLPLFSRLGPYDRSLLDRYAYEDHEAFEYWAHDASLVDAELQPFLRWRMTGEHKWGEMRRWATAKAELIERLHEAVLAEGPVSAGELDGSDRKKGPWWAWGDTKRSLEHLFHAGRVGAIRRRNFERVYCDPALVVHPEIRARPTPPEREAIVALLDRSARGHGVATVTDLADYFRLPIKTVRPLVAEMTGAGLLHQVTVEGWRQPAYVHPEARIPRRVDAAALVSPFDSVMWGRERVERLFGFRYRIEIYVPKPKRVYGYYVLPFLLGDRYVARVDLKADRPGSRLLVQAAHAEPGVDTGAAAERLAAELRLMASWLALDEVVVGEQGDLAPALRAANDQGSPRM